MAGNVTVEVTANDQQYSADGVLFEYQPPVVVSALTPGHGPIAGGTLVTVSGAGFAARSAALGYLRCDFNGTQVVARRLNATALRCVAPPGWPRSSRAAPSSTKSRGRRWWCPCAAVTSTPLSSAG